MHSYARDPDKAAAHLKHRFQQVTRRLEWRGKHRRLWRVIGISAATTAIVVGLLSLLIMSLSPWPVMATIRHVAAAPNCAAARAVGLAPARRGQPGYWSRHDRDNDGIACEPWPRGHSQARETSASATSSADHLSQRAPSGRSAQKPTIDELTKPYDAKTRVILAPPSSGQMDRQLEMLVLGGLGVFIIGSAIFRFREHRTQRKRIERDRVFLIERDFRNIFMVISTGGKEALIKRWMARQKCDRLEAMRLAVEEWRRENR